MKVVTVISMLLIVCCHTTMANENLISDAADFYQLQNWTQSAKAYQQLVEEQPENEQAWYRLSQSFLQLGQGQKALSANNKLSSAKKIPPGFVLYQKAQAHALLTQEKQMWDSLDQAVKAGFTNLQDLSSHVIWSKYQSDEKMKNIKKLIDMNQNPCKYNKKYNDFDFWLGRWEVYGNPNKSGPLYGHNTITKEENGCLIMEHWKGASGGAGTSMNYYNGIEDKWVQNWVSSGVVIDYKGGLIEVAEGKKAMHLSGKIYYESKQQQPQIRAFRGTWTPIEGGVVRQYFEESKDGGKTWNSWFDGYYFPLEDE